MRIRVLSNLHLHQHASAAPPGDDTPCDVVVLAGNIHRGLQGLDWAAATFAPPIIYVLGPLEYGDAPDIEFVREARSRAEHLGIHLLEGDSVRLGGVRFTGCTFRGTNRSLGVDMDTPFLIDHLTPADPCVVVTYYPLSADVKAEAERSASLRLTGHATHHDMFLLTGVNGTLRRGANRGPVAAQSLAPRPLR